MDIDYATTPPEALVKALETAGRTPDRALLEACLARRDEVIPGLLAMLHARLDQGYEEEWDGEDPRWYREVHAGLLLIALREEQALPRFAEIFRDEDYENLWDWFGAPFSHYGPPALDMLIELVKDRKASIWGRIGASEKLKDIALLHPETRDRIVEVLRLRLPRVEEHGRFVVPPTADEEQINLWTWVVLALAELKDSASRPQGEALYRADLIDETIMGDIKAYRAIFDEDRRDHVPKPFDLIESYHPSPETIARREAAMEKEMDKLDAAFLALSPDDLLRRLATAGPTPEPGLIRTCLTRQGAITPGLLDLLGRYHDPASDEDDPRWYGPIHAGRLLIAFKEKKALPLFERVLREDEAGYALEWFEEELPYIGPPAMPILSRLLSDASLPSATRITSTMMVKEVARLHPDVTSQAVALLRGLLPPLSERNEPVVSEEAGEAQIAVFTFVALALARLRDTTSQAQVAALHDWYLIDESVYGDYDDYLEIFQEDDDLYPPSPAFDLEGSYVRAYLAAKAMADEPAEEPDEPRTQPLLGYGGEATFIRAEPKVGRNDPCPCGSGKKYKKCCGRR